MSNYDDLMNKVQQAIQLLQEIADETSLSIDDIETISSTIEVLTNIE